MFFKARIVCNQINQALFVAVKGMIYLKFSLVIAANKLISFCDVIAGLVVCGVRSHWHSIARLRVKQKETSGQSVDFFLLK